MKRNDDAVMRSGQHRLDTACPYDNEPDCSALEQEFNDDAAMHEWEYFVNSDTPARDALVLAYANGDTVTVEMQMALVRETLESVDKARDAYVRDNKKAALEV